MRAVAADEARARLRAFASLEPERVALLEAAGRVLGEDLVADSPLPAWPRAAMDGFAVRAGDTAVVTLEVIGEVPVGGTYAGPALGRGQAVAIATGGVVPAGADAVVMVEDTARAGNVLAVQRPATPGQHVLGVGADVALGERLLARGRRLRPADLAVLAAFGRTHVQVFRRQFIHNSNGFLRIFSQDARAEFSQAGARQFAALNLADLFVERVLDGWNQVGVPRYENRHAR